MGCQLPSLLWESWAYDPDIDNDILGTASGILGPD